MPRVSSHVLRERRSVRPTKTYLSLSPLALRTRTLAARRSRSPRSRPISSPSLTPVSRSKRSMVRFLVPVQVLCRATAKIALISASVRTSGYLAGNLGISTLAMGLVAMISSRARKLKKQRTERSLMLMVVLASERSSRQPFRLAVESEEVPRGPEVRLVNDHHTSPFWECLAALGQGERPTVDSPSDGRYTPSSLAGIAQLVEHQLPKLRVAGSNPAVRFVLLSFRPAQCATRGRRRWKSAPVQQRS